MPSTYPISMNEVRTNGAGLYVSMFFISKKIDTEGEAVDQFYWVRSNSRGAAIDERDNRIPVNGASWWSSQATALANVPVGYDGTEVESNFENEKVLSFLAPFPTDSITPFETNYERVQKTKSALGAFADIGGNGFILELRWENVFKNINQQNANADSSWALYDEIIEHAKNKGLKVSLRICVDMDDGTLNVNGTGTAFYGLDNQAKDEWGYVGRIEYGFGHCSLNYPTGTAMIFDFVQKVLTRYSNKLGSQFYWYSVTTTAQRESGYNYENQNFDMPGRPLYKALFDHSTHALTAFIAWCQAKYPTIQDLRNSWGSSEGSFNDIQTPKSGLNSPGTSSEQPFLDIFKTNKGKDFWQFTYQTIKAFQTTCYNMRPSGVKYFLEYGSCSDIMSALRYSCFISDAASYSDGLKAQFSGFSAQRDLSFSLDVIRSNYSKKKGTEVSWADIYSDNPDRPSQYGATQVSQIKDIAVQLAKTAIDSQAKEIIIIAEYSMPAVFQAMMEATTEIKAYLNNFNGETPIVATANYKLGEVLNNYGSVIQRWRDASGDTTRRVNFVQSPTIDYDGGSTGGGGGGGIEDESPNMNIFSLYPISRYNIKDNSLKSLSVAQYGTDGRPSYDIPNTFVLELPTHTINYLDEFLARSTIKVVGSDGLEYLRTTQFDGVFTRGEKTEGQLAYIASNYPSAKFAEDGYSNNHPNRYYTGTGGDDAVFVLPYNDSSLTWYDVTIKNTGASTILFDVYNPDQSMGPLVNFRNHAVTAGSSYTYRINVSAIRDYPWWLRTVKVNNNRRN